MLQILQAITTKASTIHQMTDDLDGGFWTLQAPPGVALPYAVIVPPDNAAVQFDTSDNYTQECIFKVQITGASLAQVKPIADVWRDQLTYEQTRLASGRVVRFALASEGVIDYRVAESSASRVVYEIEFNVIHQQFLQQVR